MNNGSIIFLSLLALNLAYSIYASSIKFKLFEISLKIQY